VFLGRENYQHYLDRRNKMSLKVRDVIRELKKFPDNYKVSLETYEEDKNNDGGYKKTNCISVDKDVDAENFVVIK